MMDVPYGETLPYWKTGRSSPDVWIGNTIRVLQKLGAEQISEMFGSTDGRGAFVLSFHVNTEQFRVVWPVLRVKKPEDQAAARIQAATMLYHECKARALAAAVFGVRAAFIGNLVLADNRTVVETSTPELTEHLKQPRLLTGPN